MTTATALNEHVLTAAAGAVHGPSVEEADLIYLPRGLPGFPDANRFELGPLSKAPADFVVLRSVEDTQIAFIAMKMAEDAGIYEPSDLEAARTELGASWQDLQLFLLVNVMAEPRGSKAYVNLRAPLLIDARHRRGLQAVLANPAYPLRQELPQARPQAS